MSHNIFLEQKISTVLQESLRSELQDLLDRISQDLFHETKTKSSSSSSTSLYDSHGISHFYQDQVDEKQLSQISCDHITREESKFLNECAEKLLDFGENFQSILSHVEQEVTDLHETHKTLSNILEHYDMISSFWLDDDQNTFLK